MSVFRRLFGPRWDTFAGMLWPSSFHDEVQAELVRLDNELRLRQSRLLRCRQQIEKLRGRVEGSERLQARLRSAERTYDRLRVRLQKWKEKQNELRSLLRSASDHRTTASREEENDCDYPF
jgi:hypothetical protein